MNWISTKDRLPDKDGEYLCCNAFRTEESIIFDYEYFVVSFALDRESVDCYDMPDLGAGFYDIAMNYDYKGINVGYWCEITPPILTTN